MKKYIDCTLPLYNFMPVGNVWAWDVPFQSEPITTHTNNSYELWMITMHSEAGTRLMIKAMQDPNAPTIDCIPLEQLVNREAVILSVPCSMEGAVSKEQIEAAFLKVDYRKGDVVILHTGWGDNNRWEKLGDDYARCGPCVSKEGAQALCRIMRENSSDLAGADVAYWGRGDKYQRPEWANKAAWERHPYPSIQAKRYLAQYTAKKAIEDWESPNVMTMNNINFIGAMVNLDQITKQRVKVTVLPMKLKGARGATCNVFIEEDQ